MHAGAVREHARERPAPEGAGRGGARRAAADLPARFLEHAAVGHARRAHRLARAAVEALVEVVEQRIAGPDAALGEAAHQVDAAARRVGLDLELAIGGAGGEAEPAVDAGVEVGARGRVLSIEPGAGSGQGRGGFQVHARSIAFGVPGPLPVTVAVGGASRTSRLVPRPGGEAG